MQLLLTSLFFPDLSRVHNLSVPRVHAGDGLVMLVDHRPRNMRVIRVTMMCMGEWVQQVEVEDEDPED
jgi:hypothetical protein